MNIYTIIVAAGKGSRMNSEHSKLIQKIYGKEMIKRVVEIAEEIDSSEIITVVGYKKEEIKEVLKDKNIVYAYQEEQLGTGHAVMKAMPFLEDKEEGKVIILYGDVPIVRAETIKGLIEKNIKAREAATVLTAIYDNPVGYGRIIRDEGGSVESIREEKDASSREKQIKEINGGIYCFDLQKLREVLNEMKINEEAEEYYLTDTIKLLNQRAYRTGAYIVKDNTEILGVNNRIQLEMVTRILRKRINDYHMVNGITIEDSTNTYIEENVEIGKDTVIAPNTYIKNGAKIGSRCNIGFNSYISESAEIGDGKNIEPFTKI